jgi:hypothetical protein
MPKPPKYMLSFFVVSPLEPPWGLGHVMRIIDHDQLKAEPETEAWCLEAIQELSNELGCGEKRISLMGFYSLWG